MTVTDTNVELLAVNPDAVAEKIARHLAITPRDLTADLTYTPTGPHSFYRDKVLGGPAAEARLVKHAEEMDQARKTRAERARRALASFEVRVEPNRTAGEGGYFSPPLWLDRLFATANRPKRVLADLIRARFVLPPGVSSINVPIINLGSSSGTDRDTAAVASSDVTDSAGSSAVVSLAGYVDVSLQLLEQSPQAAPVDFAIFTDLAEATDAQLETQLLSSSDGATGSLLGITNVSGIIGVTYTSGSPTGSGMYPLLGQMAARIGDARFLPPECFLMRTARWAWLATSEDTAGLPFALYSPYYLGNTDGTPDPIGAIAGWPVFLDDAILANLGAGNQDTIICLRPSDLILFEGDMQTAVMRETLSATLGARIEAHTYAAAIVNRRPAGIATLTGTGMTVQAGF